MLYQNLHGKHFLQTLGSSQQWAKACLSPKIKYPVIGKSFITLKQTGWEIYIYIEAQSYTNWRVNKPYLALNSEIYISLRHLELRSYKKIGYEFYCEELFIVQHKSSYSCESTIYFNLTMDIIKNNCNFDFYFNDTDITPTVLDGGDKIVWANWPSDKCIICNINNDIPIKVPSHPHVLVNRNILCNCGMEADYHHLLE